MLLDGLRRRAQSPADAPAQAPITTSIGAPPC
jgi:hypothetical protein